MNGYEFLSDLEKLVYDWLTRKKIPFTTQQPMFGFSGELGSATIDFLLENNLVWRVMGTYYHRGLEASSRDLFGREQLLNAGYNVVDILEADLTKDKIDHTLELALLGQETLR